MNSGKGILYDAGTMDSMWISFPGLDPMYGEQVIIRFFHIAKGSKASELVRNLSEDCIKMLDGSAPEEIRSYYPVLRECFGLYRKGALGDFMKPYPKSGKPSPGESSLSRWKSRNYSVPVKDDAWPSYRFPYRMEELGRIPVPPVPARCAIHDYTPSYSSMTVGQYIYYQYWKERTLAGVQDEAQDGYVWLYVNEMMHDGSLSPEEVSEALSLCGGDTAIQAEEEWCVIHDLVPRRCFSGCYGAGGAIILGALKAGPPRELSGGVLRSILARTPPEEEIRAVNGCISALYREGKLETLVNLDSYEETEELLIRHAAFRKRCRLSVPADRESIIRFIGSLSAAYREIKKGSGKIPGNIRPDCQNIIAEACREAISESGRYDLKRITESVALDDSAVAAAESDLDAVTRMMFSEEDGEKHQIIIEKPAISGDPWEDLRVKLSGGDLDYLKQCLDAGRYDRKAEDRINGLSFEILGDVIVADGSVISDYEEKVRMILQNQ